MTDWLVPGGELFPRPGYRPEGHVPEPTTAPATPAPIATEHQACRGDDVEAFIKRQRDEYEPTSPEWHALDGLLDDYRQCADTGMPLNRAAEAGPPWPGEE